MTFALQTLKQHFRGHAPTVLYDTCLLNSSTFQDTDLQDRRSRISCASPNLAEAGESLDLDIYFP